MLMLDLHLLHGHTFYESGQRTLVLWHVIGAVQPHWRMEGRLEVGRFEEDSYPVTGLVSVVLRVQR